MPEAVANLHGQLSTPASFGVAFAALDDHPIENAMELMKTVTQTIKR